MLTGKQIREARNRAGWSQEFLADMLGVTLRSVGNWERGSTAPQSREPALRRVLAEHLYEPEVEQGTLSRVSDMELISELARRLARTTGKGVGNDENGSASNTKAGTEPAQDHTKVTPIFGGRPLHGVDAEDEEGEEIAAKDKPEGIPPRNTHDDD